MTFLSEQVLFIILPGNIKHIRINLTKGVQNYVSILMRYQCENQQKQELGMWLSDRMLAQNLLGKYIRKGPNKWKITLYSWVRRLRIDRMSCLPRFIGRFVTITIQILERFKKVYSKIHMEKQRTGINKNYLKRITLR